jgi:hypothetical protein
MRRTLILAVLCGGAVLATWKWGVGLLVAGPVDIAPGATPLTDMLIVAVGLAWVVVFTCQAVRDTAEVIADGVARWRRWRAVATYRIGSAPARPDAVANPAA